jgi:chromosome segregation ATPase
MNRILQVTIICIAASAWGYYYYPQLVEIYKYKKFESKVCDEPITYYVEPVDRRFNITQEELEKVIEEATLVWELEANRDLFASASSKDADVTIKTIFDTRQAVTDQLDSLNQKIDIGLDSITLDKNSVQAEERALLNMRNAIVERIKKYELDLSQYNATIAEYNQRGTISQIEISNIQRQKEELDREKREIDLEIVQTKKEEEAVKEKIRTINTGVASFNKSIDEYNAINLTRGREFREGEYKEYGNKREINIYEFESRVKLKRLLIHELGHALRLEHVENTKSIMNAYNASNNLELTEEDKNELRKVCRL